MIIFFFSNVLSLSINFQEVQKYEFLTNPYKKLFTKQFLKISELTGFTKKTFQAVDLGMRDGKLATILLCFNEDIDLDVFFEIRIKTGWKQKFTKELIGAQTVYITQGKYVTQLSKRLIIGADSRDGLLKLMAQKNLQPDFKDNTLVNITFKPQALADIVSKPVSNLKLSLRFKDDKLTINLDFSALDKNDVPFISLIIKLLNKELLKSPLKKSVDIIQDEKSFKLSLVFTKKELKELYGN